MGYKKDVDQNVAPNIYARNDEYYNMNHKRRGHALIFHHGDRTTFDCETLVATLRKLDFEIKLSVNLSYRDIQAQIINAANSDHTDSDCILVVVLTNGNHGVLQAKDRMYEPESLWTPFTSDKCLTLAGKPKLFLIQTYQNDKKYFTQGTSTSSNDNQRLIQPDFLIAYSTIPDTPWLDPSRDSRFIQALCAEFNESGFIHHLLTILTLANYRMRTDYGSYTSIKSLANLYNQIPCVTSTLTRFVKFNIK